MSNFQKINILAPELEFLELVQKECFEKNLAFELATLPENGFGHTNFSRRRRLKAQKKY